MGLGRFLKRKVLPAILGVSDGNGGSRSSKSQVAIILAGVLGQVAGLLPFNVPDTLTISASEAIIAFFIRKGIG